MAISRAIWVALCIGATISNTTAEEAHVRRNVETHFIDSKSKACKHDWFRAAPVKHARMIKQYAGFFMELTVQVESPAHFTGVLETTKMSGVSQSQDVHLWNYKDGAQEWIGTKVFAAHPAVDGNNYETCLRVVHSFSDGTVGLKNADGQTKPYPLIKRYIYSGEVIIGKDATLEIAMDDDVKLKVHARIK